ncbi:GerA spore germination protein [Halobacillus dabanensis]|uniref:GerA spore germination protein n=1 Tax=Halobacillus dabanensis TaxID=240302 RepID=A0A1I3YQW8_HALDA|nr:spore germination protein [Halobacillus dabanensis]SFK33749.1 GerA spore germination protein [Halobacillus dabanensis]
MLKKRGKGSNNKINILPGLEKLKESADFIHYKNDGNPGFYVNYFKSLIDVDILHRDILRYVSKSTTKKLSELKNELPIEVVMETSDVEFITDKIFRGFVFVQLENDLSNGLLIRAEKHSVRDVTIPEVEYSVIGPKESFVESYEVNLNLIRSRLPDSQLRLKQYKIGSLSRSKVGLLYMDGLTNQENVETVNQRLEDIDIDMLNDISNIAELISDSQLSPFPQLLDTERPDRTCAALAEGKVVILMDRSPHVLLGPTSLIEFFSSFEDYYIHWILASMFRLIRLVAVILSIVATPIYVAVLTYHHEVLPQDLIGTLVTSRRNVPFPPILEAIILELTIELLREAGARLPTKIGQTIGIVGGIVIGTAAVQAGLTSNILLIIVALSALGSFTTPIYNIGNTIRLIRFPLLIFGSLFGLLGVVICVVFILAHLIQLTSLGRPYMEPIYPFRFGDFRDAIVRLTLRERNTRPVYLRTQKPIRFPEPEKDNKSTDIYE